MKILLTTTIVLGFLVALDSQPAKAWGYNAIAYRQAHCYSQRLDRAFGREAIAYGRPTCGEGCQENDIGWRYPRYFIPDCRLFCHRDFLGNLYGCFTKCF